MEKKEAEKLEQEIAERQEKRDEENKEKYVSTEPEVESLPDEDNKETKDKKEEFDDSLKLLTDKLDNINNKKEEPEPFTMKFNIPDKKESISFNDKDSVLDMGTNKESIIEAPKTIERLEEVSKINNEKRKAEDDDDDDDGPLKISSDSIKLDFSDVHDLEKEKKLEPAIKLDIETLS